MVDKFLLSIFMQSVTVLNVQDIKNSGGLVTGKLVFEMFMIKRVNSINKT